MPSKRPAYPHPSQRLGRALARLLAYGGATILFGLLALGPAVAAIGLAGTRNPFGWLLAAAWSAVVVVVVWGFGAVAEAPAGGPVAATRPAPRRSPLAGLRRTRRFVRHHRRIVARQVNILALSGAASVAVLMVLVLVKAWA